MGKDYTRDILAMGDAELETFVDLWLSKKKTRYVSSQRFAGAGDLGRDVVGYCTPQKFDGEWHNYQCKQLGVSLAPAMILAELAKILVHSSRGEFRLPERYYFVAPLGVGRNARNLLTSPSKLKQRLVDDWDTACATKVEAGLKIPLDAALLATIDQFKFENVSAYDAGELQKDEDCKPALVATFGDDPGRAPRGIVPPSVDLTSADAQFAAQLIGLYGGQDTAVVDQVTAHSHAVFGKHLRDQFVRYFDAEAFKRYYRDNTPANYVPDFEDEIYHGVVHTYNSETPDTLDRVDAVTHQAGTLQPSGVLGKHASIPAKQGICHHFVNVGRMKWKK